MQEISTVLFRGLTRIDCEEGVSKVGIIAKIDNLVAETFKNYQAMPEFRELKNRLFYALTQVKKNDSIVSQFSEMAHNLIIEAEIDGS